MLNDIYDLQKNLISENRSGIALDIDETLSWTIGWWVEKMQKLFGNPESLSVEELIDKYKYTQNVPYWQTEEALEWMDNHRTSVEVQEQLPLIPDVHEYVSQIHEIIPVVAYITTRPDSVNPGTYKWLEKHRFPAAPVISRPRYVDHSAGNIWKSDVLNYLYPQVQGIIDDNPGLANEMSHSYQGTIYLYDSEYAPRQDIKVIACKDWKKVLENVQIK